jgi:hypothetical protein
LQQEWPIQDQLAQVSFLYLRIRKERVQFMRRQVIILLSIVFSSLPSWGWALSGHGHASYRAFAQITGSIIERLLPLDDPARLIVLGLLLIGLSVVVRRGIPGKRGR